MSKENSTGEQADQNGRRQFLEGMALGAGGLAFLSAMSTGAQAQNAPPPPAGAAGAARNPPPPPMTVSQPAPLKDVAGKVAYITASSDGIGLGIARACSNAGMKVVIGYRNELRLAEALPLFPKGNPVFSVKHDVTDRDGWKRALDQINQKFGNLHLLVNNAGAKDLAALSRGTFQDWDNSVAVDFTGAFNGISTVIPHFKAHGEGAHIVNTCSVSGIIPAGSAGMYLAVKMGSMGLIEGLRVELQGTNIGTSAFCPGGVVTDNRPGDPKLEKPIPGAPPHRSNPVMMDPLEAGERVVNGVRNNDLYILTHPEFRPGMQQKFDAIMASIPPETAPWPRVLAEQPLVYCNIFPLELAHRNQPRQSYRG